MSIAGRMNDCVAQAGPGVSAEPGEDPDRVLREAERRLNALVSLPDAVLPDRDRCVAGPTANRLDPGPAAIRREILLLVDGRRILSCLTLAVMTEGASITTIEGLAKDGALHPLQQAFIDHDAFQCGYCTPGQICWAAGLLAEGKAKTAEQIRELMSGNICRCGAYTNIVAAIQQAMGQS